MHPPVISLHSVIELYKSGFKYLFLNLKTAWPGLLLALIPLLLLPSFFPALKGKPNLSFLNSSLRKEHSQILDFFANQDVNSRIGLLPTPSKTDKTPPDWDQPQSNISLAGLPQTLLNPSYSEALTAALYSQDQKSFESLVNQYALNWIVIDKSANLPDSILSLFKNSAQLQLEANFGDKVLIYKASNNSRIQNFLSLSSPTSPTIFPFAQLSSQPTTSWQVDLRQKTISIQFPPLSPKTTLSLPSYSKTERLVPVQISYQKDYPLLHLRLTPLLPRLDSQPYPSQTSLLSFRISADQNSFSLRLNSQTFEFQLPIEVSRQTDFYPLATTHLPSRDPIELALSSNQDLVVSQSFVLNPQTPQSFSLDLSKDSTPPTLSLPLIDSPYVSIQTPKQNSLAIDIQSCDPSSDGPTQRTISESQISYTSQNASACDSLDLPSLPHASGYLLNFLTRNQAGLAPLICLQNPTTGRCDVFERLTDSKNYSSQSLIQTINNPFEQDGYSLKIANQSFDFRKSQNSFQRILVTPFPLNFLKNITLSSQDNPYLSSPQLFDISRSTHPTDFLYTASLSSDQPTQLNLYQPSSSHWQAFLVNQKEIQASPALLLLKLPYLYFTSSRLKPVNSAQLWHNAYSLPTGSHQIIIFSSSQYLKFTVFLLLAGLTPAYFLYKKSRHQQHLKSK